jgi:SAM-dependent methyltransferase
VHPSDQLLLEEAAALCRDPRFRALILRHCSHLDPAHLADAQATARFSTRIHAGDQMLLHSLREHRHAGAALSQYFNIALQQHNAAQQAIRACFDPSDPTTSVLDFACGYGRLLRFLSLAIPPSRLTASELQADALAFVGHEFGVPTIASHADPARFEPGRRFDCIWVASLFSHLPECLFNAWLQKLLSLLTPRGILCFSVRDSALLPPGWTLPASGIAYTSDSENPALGADIYGTTWASEAFVRDAPRRWRPTLRPAAEGTGAGTGPVHRRQRSGARPVRPARVPSRAMGLGWMGAGCRPRDAWSCVAGQPRWTTARSIMSRSASTKRITAARPAPCAKTSAMSSMTTA